MQTGCSKDFIFSRYFWKNSKLMSQCHLACNHENWNGKHNEQCRRENKKRKGIEVDDIDSVLSLWNYTRKLVAGAATMFSITFLFPHLLLNSTKVSQITSYHLALTWLVRRSLPRVSNYPVLWQEFKCLFRWIYLFDNKRILCITTNYFPKRNLRKLLRLINFNWIHIGIRN